MQLLSTLGFEQGFSLNLELTNSASLADPQASETLLPSQPILTPGLKMNVALGGLLLLLEIRTQILMLAWFILCQTEPSPSILPP